MTSNETLGGRGSNFFAIARFQNRSEQSVAFNAKYYKQNLAIKLELY